MAERSQPWAGTVLGDAGPYTDLQWQQMLKSFTHYDRTEIAVVQGVGGELRVVSLAPNTLKVYTGQAWVDGNFYVLDAEVNFAPASGPRTDNIILRKTFATQQVRITIQDAVIPIVQVDGVTWEVVLASCAIDAFGVETITQSPVGLHMNTQVKTAMIDLLAVTTQKIALKAVEDAQLGIRAGRFLRVYSVGSTVWDFPGTVASSPGHRVTMQMGTLRVTVPNGAINALATVTLDVNTPYTSPPGYIALCNIKDGFSGASTTPPVAYPLTTLLTSFTINVIRGNLPSTVGAQIHDVFWLTIGKCGGAVTPD